MRFGIVELYCGKSGKKGFYNSQEIGLARAMNKLGYTVFVFFPSKNILEIKEEIVDGVITVVYVPAKTLGNHSRYDWNVLLRYKIDVVQLGADNQLFAPDLLKFCDKKNILSYNFIGTVKSDSKSKIKRGVMNFIYNRNLICYKKHKCFAKTKSVKKELIEHGINDVCLAPVGLDTSVIPIINESRESLRTKLGLPLDEKLVLFVGRLDEYKRPQLMLSLIRALPDNYQGIMIGDGVMAATINRGLRDFELNDRVKQIRSIPNTQIHAYYKICDYFVNFNEHEIFGMSILEAMYQGCSVIAFHAPGPNEIIEDNVSGWLVDSVEEMIKIIISDRKMDSDLVKDHVANEFTWDKTAQVIDSWIKGKGCYDVI